MSPLLLFDLTLKSLLPLFDLTPKSLLQMMALLLKLFNNFAGSLLRRSSPSRSPPWRHLAAAAAAAMQLLIDI